MTSIRPNKMSLFIPRERLYRVFPHPWSSLLLRWAVLLLFLIAILLGCTATESTPSPTPASTTPAPTPSPDEPTPGATARPLSFDINADMYVRQVQEGVFVVTHAFPWPGNSMLVEMQNADLVLVDTPYTPQATKELLDWAKAQFSQREIVAINTGYHYDNLGGNGYLVEAGIPVYGSELTAQLLEERGAEMRSMTLSWLEAPQQERYYQAHESLPYVPPTHLFALEQGLELEFGDETVQVYYPGPSHAPDNVVVYFPTRKLLFGGCMAWPESVRDLARFDFDVLVPGHGERFDPGLLEHTINLLVAFHE
jgi:metallo-beta-lactamase class B